MFEATRTFRETDSAEEQPSESERPYDLESSNAVKKEKRTFRRLHRAVRSPSATTDQGVSKVRLAQLAAWARDEQDESRTYAEPFVGQRDEQLHEQAGSAQLPMASSSAGRLVQRWVPGRWPTVSRSRRRAIGILAVLFGIAIVLGLTAWIIGRRPDPERPPSLTVASAVESAAVTDTDVVETTSKDKEPLVISVVGKVATPGLITVPADARVADAIEEAGGADQDADLLTVNLARQLVDGEQLYVGVPVPPGLTSDSPEVDIHSGPEGKVDLNRSDQQQLETLPGVGAVTAEAIVEWRNTHGNFTAVEQLREIDGIGEKRFARLRDEVTVG